jgi:ubiquinone/menaquinone biosynthesis C-methylase UbiE
MDADQIQKMKSGMGGMFSRAAESYDQVGPQFFKPLGKRLVELANLPVGASVLDVAAGRGAVLFPAAEQVGAQGKVIGIDIAQGMVDQTNVEIQELGLTNAEMRVMDAEALDFDDESFDAVLCGFGIFFFPQRESAFAEFRRVLKSGGILGVSTWGRDDERWKWMGELREKYRTPNMPSPPSGPNPFSNAEGLAKMLQDAGFEQVRTIGEDPEFIYANEDIWWATQWSHGGRWFLESLSHEDRDHYKADAFEKLQTNKGEKGFYQTFATLYTLSVKP